MASRHWLYFGGFLVSVVFLVGVGLLGLLDALSVLSGGPVASGEFVVLAMLGEAAEWVVAALVVGLLAVVFLAASVVSILRNTSVHRDDRLVSLVERAERKYPILREFDVVERVEPTTADRREELREEYVEGEMSEREFEREMERLLDDDGGRSRDRERSREDARN